VGTEETMCKRGLDLPGIETTSRAYPGMTVTKFSALLKSYMLD